MRGTHQRADACLEWWPNRLKLPPLDHQVLSSVSTMNWTFHYKFIQPRCLSIRKLSPLGQARLKRTRSSSAGTGVIEHVREAQSRD